MQITEAAFEQDLQQAILASKIEFEENHRPGETGSTEKKANKKTVPMSLQSFNNLSIKNGASPTKTGKPHQGDDNFFGDIEAASKQAVIREQMREDLRQRSMVIFS